jgi:hypothetical protein
VIEVLPRPVESAQSAGDVLAAAVRAAHGRRRCRQPPSPALRPAVRLDRDVFHAGEVFTGWETGSPSVFQIPPPSEGMVDHTLGQARHPEPGRARRRVRRPSGRRATG